MRHLDKVAACAGVLLGLFLILRTIISPEPTIQSAITGAVALTLSASYLYWRARSRPLFAIPQLQGSGSVTKLLNILFFSALSYNILSLNLAPDAYVRPAGYFVSLFLLIGVLAVEILLLPGGRAYGYFVLLKIVLIPLNIVWSQMLMFATVIGGDSWVHLQFTQEILDSGKIPEASSYFTVPVMHLVSGMTSLVTGLSYQMASLFSISLLQTVVPLLFVFLLGRFFFEAKTGLLAALLLGVSSSFNSFIYWTVPFAFAAVLLPVITYLLFKMRRERSLGATLLVLFMMAILILAHPLTSFCMALLFFSFWAGSGLVTRIYQVRAGAVVTFGIAIFFVAGMLAWWTYVSGDILLVGNLIRSSFMGHYFPGAKITPEIFQYARPALSGAALFNGMGGVLFWVIALPGSFYMVSREVKSPYAFDVAVGGMTILGVAFVATLLGWYEVLGYRWHHFAALFLSIPLAVSLYLFAARIRMQAIKALCVTGIVLALSFLMLMSSLGNLDSPLFTGSRLPRPALTSAELQAMETLLKTTGRKIATDDIAGSIATVRDITLLAQAQARISGFADGNRALYARDFSDYRGSIIVIRREISQHPMTFLSSAPVRLDYDPAQLLSGEGFARIYESGSVSAFYWGD